mmetsp:Transcript_21200/g.35082  ORF Transcript_21200/g.35082 Transcript_21200/m.35082 type:complete len:187 (+) Transcript_21200:91-651(+)
MATTFPGAGAAPPQQEPADNGKLMSLTDKIDKSDCYARNEASGFPMTNLFIGDSRLGCKSDADEQLIIHISFQEFVKVHSLKFAEFNQGINPEENPTKIQLYVNRENLGFEDCEDVDPEQILELTAADLRESADPITLKYVKFQRVKSLTFFIEDNAGGDVSALGSLKIFGRPIQTMNMNDFKKQG